MGRLGYDAPVTTAGSGTFSTRKTRGRAVLMDAKEVAKVARALAALRGQGGGRGCGEAEGLSAVSRKAWTEGGSRVEGGGGTVMSDDGSGRACSASREGHPGANLGGVGRISRDKVSVQREGLLTRCQRRRHRRGSGRRMENGRSREVM